MWPLVRRYIDVLILIIPTPLVFALFFSNIPTFCSFKKLFFVLVPVLFCNLCNNFFAQYKHIWATMGIPRQPYEGLHIMFYTRRSTHNGHQLYAFKGQGVDLEVEGVRYVEMHRGLHRC